MHFTLRRLSEYSKATLLKELRRVATLLGESNLSQSAFRENSRASPSTVRRHFGSWEEGLRAAGLRTSTTEKVSTTAALAEIARVEQLLAPTEALTITFFQRQSEISPKVIIGHFGTWRKALEAAGFAHRFDASSQKISRDAILLEIQRVAELVQTKELTIQQFERHSRFGAKVASKQFGSWHQAAREAGVAGDPRGETKGDDECFDNLLTVWTHYGRAPTQREMGHFPSQIGATVYVRRFGGWIKALEAFVTRVNQDVADLQAPTSAPLEQVPRSEATLQTSAPTVVEREAALPRRVPESDRREIRLGLRYAVLSRDKFRCVVCGRSPATALDVVLHVDHILAWSKGGKTVLENLRTTCSDCNLGKGARGEA